MGGIPHLQVNRPLPDRQRSGRQVAGEVAQEAVPIQVEDGPESPLPGPLHVSGVVVHEEHPRGRETQSLHRTVEGGRVPLAHPGVVAVEHVVEVAKEPAFPVDLVQPLGLVAQDPQGQTGGREPVHQVDHPWADHEPGQDLPPQRLVGAPGPGPLPKGLPERRLLGASSHVPGPVDEIEARAGFDLVHRTGYVTGRAEESAFWQALRERSGARGSDEALRREILSRFVIRPWMIDLVDRLAASGLTLGILSDQTQWLDEIDRKRGLFRHFHHVFNSYHTGVSKRDPAAFDRAVERLGLPAARVLFVDDDAGNVERARERGLRAVLYLDRDRLLRDLARHLPPGSLPVG